jgi:hypothetical protein
MSFMSNHIIQVAHVNSCQFMQFMSYDFLANSVTSGRGEGKYVFLGKNSEIFFLILPPSQEAVRVGP